MTSGTVVRKISDKGFGFIATKEGDVFFHTSQCKTPFVDLNLNDKVRFDIQSSPRGPRAVSVERL